MGLLLAVVVHAANIQDRDGAKLVRQTLGPVSPSTGNLGGCWLRGPTGVVGLGQRRWFLTVVKRKPDTHHFEVLPRRWVVERTLAKPMPTVEQSYEQRTDSSEAWVHIAMVNLMLKRLQPI